MGYELKMKVGWLGGREVEHARQDKPELDGNSVWFPYIKDAKGDYVPTGRTQQYFFEVASVDLCKIYDTATAKVASDAFLSKQERENAKNVVKWFDGPNTDTCEDSYGDIPTPIALGKVITALKKDVKVLIDDKPYRRFVWALALLEAVASTNEGKREFVVLFEAH